MSVFLPGEHQIAELTVNQMEAHDALEAIVANLTEYVREYELGDSVPDPMPDNANVGELYLCAYYSRIRAAEFISHAERIEELLPALGEIQHNATLRGAV